jgi:hypothetical protein
VVPRHCLLVSVLAALVLGAAGAGAAADQPLSLEACLLSGDAEAAAGCLDGQLGVEAAPPVSALPASPCTDAVNGHCPSWTANYDDPSLNGRSDQFPRDMAISPDGVLTVIAAEDVDFNRADPYSSTSAWAVVAYDTATGAERWRSTWRSGGGYDAPGGLTFSPDGRRIFVTGESYSYGNPLTVPSDSVLTTIAYDSATGARLWRASSNSVVGLDNGRAAVASPNGKQVYVSAVSDTGHGDLDYVTAAYLASNGTLLWTARYTGLGTGGLDSPFALAVDPKGAYVYVTGWSAGSAEFDVDYATVAYAIHGNSAKQAWVARYDGVSAHLPDEAFALGVDPAGGRVYVTGLSVGLTADGAKRTYDYGTVAYDARRGTELWRSRWAGAGSGFNSATALAVTAGRVFVTGQSASPNGTRDNDFGTVAYDGASGRRLWARQDGMPRYDGEFALSLAAAPDGARVYATGVSSSSDQQGLGDQLTIAYDAATGLPAWQARLNDTGLDDDIGTVVHVTPDGQRVITSGQFVHGGIDTSGRGNVYDVGTAAYPSR